MMMRISTYRVTSCILKQLCQTGYSSPPASQIISCTLCSTLVEKDNQGLRKEKIDLKSKGKLISTAFEKLKTLDDTVEVNDAVSKMILEAKDVESLLSTVSAKKLTRNHALKLVSVLADWTVEGRVQTADFETDERFAVVCRILGSNPTLVSNPAGNPRKDRTSTDLSTVLGVASDDEAAKLITNISLSQMVKVLSTLASQKRRSTPLLRSLAFNIASSSEKLDIKQGADALYAVSTLNYHDEVLLDKVCGDLCGCVMANTKRAVIGSIITSLGLLRYKHTDLLNLLSDWVVIHLDVCGPQDLISLVMTLAVIHHTPSNEDTLFPMVKAKLEISGVPNPQVWLDLVWALTVLDKQSADHVASVLSQDFADKIKAISPDGLTIPTRLKLLQINGVAKLRLKDYEGPLLNTSQEEWKIPLMRSKEKQVLVTAVQETMLNLLPSAVYLSTNVDTGMGFMIDAECLMSTKLTPLPLFDKKTKAPIDRNSPDSQKGIKVAILVLDFHDITRGRREPTGMNLLCQELVRLKGYRVMTVDYVDFLPHNTLVNRVQYLSQQLKTAIGKS